MKKLKLSAFLRAGSLSFLIMGGAQAEMMEDLTLLSPKALALANAVTADPPGVDAIHFNPAGLTLLGPSTQQFKLATFFLKTRYETGDQRVDPAAKALYEGLSGQPYPDDPYANQEGETGDAVLLVPGGSTETSAVPIVPLGGFAVRNPDNQVTFASSVYSPMMVGFSRDKHDLGRYQGTETAISRITYFSPTIALPLTDTLALGVGINFSYQGIALRMETRSPQAGTAVLGALAEVVTGDPLGPAPYDDIATLTVTVEDFVSVGYNLGLLWKPEPWLNFGFAYRSATSSNMKGDFSMKYSPEMQELTNTLNAVIPAIEGTDYESGKVSMDLNTPQHLAFGTSLLVTPRFRLNVDVQKAFYSDWDKFTFTFDQSVDFLVFAAIFDNDARNNELTLQRNYQDSVSWSIGGEYEWNDVLSIRAGYQRRNSAIPDNALDLTIPLSDADFYGLGFEYSYSEDTHFEFGMGYLISKFQIDYNQSANANGEAPLDLIYNPYAYLPIKASTRALLLSMSYIKPF